jgi:hypothetical protein
MNHLERMQRSPKRMSVTMPGLLYVKVITMADKQGRSASNFCAFLIERALQLENQE